ncbi:hypothetical protein K6U06_04920 [Acidiferrimicrobium sp. IK]|uniref:hypothetical protein n=1 Tax=Acidiferrimicrobium sp. IK TaxID=2871700 RepID=UPI0021CAE49A|nr:hypothetical protein [Acidiferrimicrobium sp. IK]MCU4183692.1 hypothetical protein [Acidiferrimicrobium sp. IK]
MNQPARHLRRPEAAPRRPAPEVPRHLRVVDRSERSPAQRQRRARMILVSGIAAAVVVMFSLVYLHVVMAQRQIELDKMSSLASTRQSQYQALRLKVAKLESPQQIISTAEGKLGMRQPAAVTYVAPPAWATAAGATSAGATSAGATSAGAASAGAGSSQGRVGGRSTPDAAASGHTPPGTVAAPAGDADWPRIKAELAGRP